MHCLVLFILKCGCVYVCINSVVACEKLLNCVQAAKVFHNFEKELFESAVVGSSNTALPAMEKLLLDMVAYECTDGVFYCLALKHGDEVVVRFFEAGCYLGLMTHTYMQHIATTAGLPTSDILLMPTFTAQDVMDRRKFIANRRQSYAANNHYGRYKLATNEFCIVVRLQVIWLSLILVMHSCNTNCPLL